ncbi:unnamed protein product, partial [Sphacelaria rigidula]
MDPSQRSLQYTAHGPPCVAQALSWMAQAQSHKPRSVIPRDPREDRVRKHRDDGEKKDTRMSPGRIPKHVMFGEIIVVKGQKREFNGRHKDWIRCLEEDMKAFGIEWQGWTTRALNAVEWHSCVEQGAERFMADRCQKDGAEAAIRHAKAAGQDAPTA